MKFAQPAVQPIAEPGGPAVLIGEIHHMQLPARRRKRAGHAQGCLPIWDHQHTVGDENPVEPPSAEQPGAGGCGTGDFRPQRIELLVIHPVLRIRQHIALFRAVCLIHQQISQRAVHDPAPGGVLPQRLEVLLLQIRGSPTPGDG